MNPADFLTVIHGDARRGNLMLGFKKAETAKMRTVPVDVQRLDLAAREVARQHEWYEAYFTPAVFAGGRRLKSQIVGSEWAALDRDDLPLADALPLPTLTICTSPDHSQDFWHFIGPVNAGQVDTVQRRIAQANGNGMQAVDAGHFFRIPGTVNHKRGGVPVEVVEYRPERVYRPQDFDHLLIAQSPPVAATEALTGTVDGLLIWQRTRRLLSAQIVALADGEVVTKADGSPYISCSEGDQALFTALVQAGLSDDEVKGAFMVTERGRAMVARHGKDTLRRIRRGIAKARAFVVVNPATTNITRSQVRLDMEVLKHFRPLLGVYGLAVYIGLLEHDNPGNACYPSQEHIAKELGILRKKVNEEIAKIARLGLARIEEKPGTRSNNYIIVHPDEINFTTLPM